MNLYQYLKDKRISIILHILGALAVGLYMSIMGNSFDSILLLLFGWFLVSSSYYYMDYRVRKHYFRSILSCLEHLKEKYLISDVLEKPRRIEDIIYHRVLHMGNKAMLEEISKIRHERNDYVEYIEQWVHEVKTPLSAMKLICDNNPSMETKKILREFERANGYVEQVLFYARSETVEKDYLIREVNLMDAVKKSLQNNKYLLREEQVQVQLDCDQYVFTDNKWLVFIIDQCVVNAAKYGGKKIIFQGEVLGSKTQLSIIDDGMGILTEDLPRIFHKGFTGKNGHEGDKSTGIGLYLCKKLCDKLSIEIDIVSEAGSYTKVNLSFATGRFVK